MTGIKKLVAVQVRNANRADDGQAHSNNDDPGKPGRAGIEQVEREMKERFHSFVVPRIRKFEQIAPLRRIRVS
jgi:hypothetical protein